MFDTGPLFRRTKLSKTVSSTLITRDEAPNLTLFSFVTNHAWLQAEAVFNNLRVDFSRKVFSVGERQYPWNCLLHNIPSLSSLHLLAFPPLHGIIVTSSSRSVEAMHISVLFKSVLS